MKFLREFVQNKGLMVFSSTIIAKLALFINTIFVVRLIDETEYGLITLIASVFFFFVPLTGAGSYQGLLRYGILEKDMDAKNNLSQYLFWRGFAYHLIISIFFFAVCCLYIFKYENLPIIIVAFTVRLIGYYFVNHIQNDQRMRGDNHTFSLVNISTSVAETAGAFCLTWAFGAKGFLFALAAAPYVSLYYASKENFKRAITKPNIHFKEFWSYSVHASITYFLSEMLFSVDFFFIGTMLTANDVAAYKVAVVLPMNLIFLAQIFLQTDIPKLTLNYRNKAYLIFYIKNYYKIFLPLGVSILLVGFTLKDWIVPFVFGNKYAGNGNVFFVILATIVGNMWLRNIYGNLLSAIGKSQWNTYIGAAAIAIIALLAYLLIPHFGILGAAMGMAVALTFTGIASFIVFFNYIQKLNNE
ncbi:MAG TPA: oligosaccharide flippase family protein [Chitinophagales bacterium]